MPLNAYAATADASASTPVWLYPCMALPLYGSTSPLDARRCDWFELGKPNGKWINDHLLLPPLLLLPLPYYAPILLLPPLTLQWAITTLAYRRCCSASSKGPSALSTTFMSPSKAATWIDPIMSQLYINQSQETYQLRLACEHVS